MSKIIKFMSELGYKPDPEGICYGLAAMGAQAVIRKDTYSYVDRIKAIKNSKEKM